jgi:putative glutamine amidotransferase
MRIAISQRDFKVPPRNFIFDCLERSWNKFLAGHQLLPLPNTMTIDNELEFDCLVLTGGPDSIERHITENLWFVRALKLDKPIVGFCHGAFAVNDLTGGVNGQVDDHQDGEHEIVLEGNTVVVNSYHSQSISSLGKNMMATAHDSAGNIEAFQHESLPVYGVVWHPERMTVPILPHDVELLLRKNK